MYKDGINKGTKKSRRIMVIKPSKYETTEAIQVSKKYWKDVIEQMDSTIVNKEAAKIQEKEEESAYLSQVLPETLYKKVCLTLDLPIKHFEEKEEEVENIEEKQINRLQKEPLLSFRKTIHIDREIDSDTDVELSPREHNEEVNVHHELLSKPEREQVTWPTHYLEPEREDEKTLVRKADDLTDRIVQEFCEYMKQLGGDQQSQLFKPKAIKELFQIEFDTHVARSLKIVPKELPSVEEKIAEITGNPEKSRYAVLEREVLKDIKAERHPDKVQAFGRSLPHSEQCRAPHNDTKALWRSARHVPKDLVSLKTVWEGITNLRLITVVKSNRLVALVAELDRPQLPKTLCEKWKYKDRIKSVKEYCRWMIEHPEFRRAPYLSSLGMFDSAVLEARLTFESLHGLASSPVASSANAPAPIEHIRRRLSQLADST